MIKRIILLLSLILVFVESSFSQQDPLFTHFIFNKMQFNPGSTGIEEGFSATTVYRNQWGKVDGAPNSSILNIEGNMSRFFPGGLGVNFYHDAIGFGRQNNLMLNYSYPIAVGRDILSVGIGVGMVNFGMKPTFITPDQTTIGLTDKAIPFAGFGSTGVDLNFGAYYKSASRFYVGLSATHLNSASLKQGVATTSYNLARHMYLMGGYKTKEVGPGYIDAQMMMRTELKKYSFDLNARYMFNKYNAYGGLTYRTSDCIAVLLGLNPITNLTVGYSYDLTLSKLTSVSRGSHEILLKYCHYLPVPPVTVSRNPRWL